MKHILKENGLIPMSDFSLALFDQDISATNYQQIILRYATFLKRDFKKEMIYNVDNKEYIFLKINFEENIIKYITEFRLTNFKNIVLYKKVKYKNGINDEEFLPNFDNNKINIEYFVQFKLKLTDEIIDEIFKI